MLVCSHCQFLNPDDHNFCQRCGSSLVQQTCRYCFAKVESEQSLCPQCGSAVAMRWWAIISGLNPASTQDQEFCLDSQQRYQPTSLNQQGGAEDHKEVEGLVCDRQPSQLTSVQVLREQMTLHQGTIDMTNPTAVKSYVQQSGLVIPPQACAYLSLQLQFPRAIPALHDAWYQQESADRPQAQILLLEDRSACPELLPLWRNDSLPAAQLLRWLNEMTDLWIALEPWGCCPSLLNLSNLRVEQGQFLTLKRLYSEGEEPSTLADLIQVWQSLLQGASTQRQQEFAPLLQELAQSSSWQKIEDLHLLLNQVTTYWETESQEAEAAALVPDSLVSLLRMTPDWTCGDVPTAILPNQLIQLESLGQTHPGRNRHHNEDFFLIHQHLQQLCNPSARQVYVQGCYVLCDGMGGHANGEVASALAAKTLYQQIQLHWQDTLPQPALLEQAIRHANQAIYDLNEEKMNTGLARMGTTLVALLIQDTQARVAHVGDSRLYRLTRRGLEQITQDHEVGQREIDRGVERKIAYARPDAHQLTQALGPKRQESLHPSIQSLELEEDSVLLLCSDGLTDNDLLEKHWETHLQPLLDFHTHLEEGLKQLIDLANQYNGHDNITVVAVRVKVRSQLPLVF